MYLGSLDIGTGLNAAGTAMTGAKIGTAILPGIGTAVGAVIGGALSLVGIGKPSPSKASWESYKGIAGKQPGRSYGEGDFANVLKGAFMNHPKSFIGTDKKASLRERWLARFADRVFKLYKGNKIPLTAGAREAFPVVTQDLMEANLLNRDALKANPILTPLLLDLLDRYLNDLPIGRKSMKAFAHTSEYDGAPTITKFSTAMKPVLAALKKKQGATTKKQVITAKRASAKQTAAQRRAQRGTKPTGERDRSTVPVANAAGSGIPWWLVGGAALALLS